jgi:hypothetical protein
VASRGPGLKVGLNGGNMKPIDDWSSVVVRGDQIGYMKVQYVPEIPRQPLWTRLRQLLWKRVLQPVWKKIL